MKRTYTFVRSLGTVQVILPEGSVIDIPVFPGILKHPRSAALLELLKNPDTACKYTLEALKKAPWPVLRQFPRSWLVACLVEADLRPGRRRALTFLLDGVRT